MTNEYHFLGSRLCRFCTVVILLSIAATVFRSRESLRSVNAAATAAPNVVQLPGQYGKVFRTTQPADRSMPHVLAATYYSVRRNLAASLMLSDQGARSFQIQPTLFSSSGNRFAVPPITLQANEVRTFDVQQWVALAGAAFQEGSLQVSYVGKDMELGGVLRLVDLTHSLIFDEELSEPMMFASSQLEGVWWLPSHKCTLSLALSNTTDSPVTALITFDTDTGRDDKSGRDDKPKIVVLASHETRLSDLKDLGNKKGNVPEIGGISIQHSGPKGGLLARGLASDASTGYSNVIEFSDPQSAKSSKLDGAGLRVSEIGKQDLRQIVVARNVSDSDITLDGRVSITQVDNSTKMISLPAVTLRKHDVRKIDLNGVINREAAKHATAVGLEFDYPGIPGSVVMAAQSVSNNETQVFRVPMIDAAAVSSSTGQYPWSIDSTSSAFVYLKNATDRPQQYNLQVGFDGGTYSLGLKTIESGQPVVFDLRALRDNQVRDVNGRKIPLNATGGHVHWSIDGDEHVGIIGRVEQVDFAKGISMTAACAECCPDSWNSFWVDPIGDDLLACPFDVTQFTAWQQNITCYGEVLDPFQRFINTFTSNNTPAVSCQSGGLATAIDEGEADISASWTVVSWDFDVTGTGGCSRFLESAKPKSKCKVRVPNHVVVLDDDTGYVCGDIARRNITYQVVDRLGRPVCGNVPVREQFYDLTTNTCGNGSPTAAGCQPMLGGIFIDHITVNCNGGPPSCGYSILKQFQWCPSNGPGAAIGTTGGYTHNNAISINGVVWPPDHFSAGTAIYP